MAYLNFFGICLGAFGAILILGGVWITPGQAQQAVGGFGSLDEREDVASPPVQNLLRQSCWAKWGTASVLAGFLLQAVAAWPF